MLKPGQCVTIDGIKLRVTKMSIPYAAPCIYCHFKHTEPFLYPCNKCRNNSKTKFIQDRCYLKPIKANK